MTTPAEHHLATRRYFNGGPGNKRDRARFAALGEADRERASKTAERLYDGSRTVARCWTEALNTHEAN